MIKATMQRVMEGQVAVRQLKDGCVIATYPSDGLVIGNDQPGTRQQFIPDKLIKKMLRKKKSTETLEIDTWSE